jgi:hypothetical protein
MRKAVLLAVGLTSCRSRDEAKPAVKATTAPAPADGADAAFVRIPAEQAKGAHYMRAGAGDRVHNPAIVGDFVCRLTTRFGPPDPYVYLFADDVPVLGFPLRHVATGVVIIGYPKEYGYASFDSPALDAVADELDALLAATKPTDCEYTYPSWYRVEHSGVANGTPFFEQVDLAKTLDARLAQFAENDEHGGDRKRAVEEKLCLITQQNWSERKQRSPGFADTFAIYSRRDDVHARLLRCLVTAVEAMEHEAADDSFDADAAPEEAEAAWTAYKDLELADPALATRIRTVRARFKRGHLRP